MKVKSIFHAYDHLAVIGGAEKVGIFLKDHLPALQLVVGGINKSCYSEKDIEGVISEIEYVDHPLRRLSRQLKYFIRKPSFLKNRDVGIYSGVYAPLAVDSSVALKIHYCHTIPRYAYDLYAYNYNKRNALGKIPFALLVTLVRYLYKKALLKMDIHYVNSFNTRQRLEKYLGIKAEILYPPVEIQKFRFLAQGDFYLSNARLEPLKRVDLVINAFKKMPDKKLVVISGGSQQEELLRLADGYPNIEIQGWVTESTMLEMVGNCIATIYVPVDEDFGMSPVESMAAGKPVIGVREGGVTETVIPEVTGWLCPPNLNESDLIFAVNWLTPERALAMKENCISKAQEFSAENFLETLNSKIYSYTSHEYGD